MVVVTSIKAARRRLRYESWHLLHLYAYLGVGLALPHQLWTGAAVPRPRPARTVFWWTAWAAAAGAVLVWRVGAAGVPQRCATTCGSPRWCREADGVVSVYVTGRDLDAAAGRGRPVLHLAVPRPGRAGPGRTPTRSPPRPTAAACGSPSRTSATAAATSPACGPAPASWSRARTAGSAPAPAPGGKVALIGAGVGITPLRALAEGLDYAPGEAVLVHRYADQPLFAARARRARAPSAGCGAALRTCRGRLVARRGPANRRPRGPARTTSPTSPTATSTSAAPRPGPTGRPGRPGRRPARPSTSTSRPSGGDPR